MKKAFLKVVCMGVITVVLFGMLCFTGCSKIKEYTKNITSDNREETEITGSIGDIKINRSGAKLYTTFGESYVEETVTATISPSTAKNKAVDWSVEWASDAALKGQAIGDYLTVTPDSDGSLTAKLRCKKSFRGSSAVLIATSRDSGEKGLCYVLYVGKPSGISVDTAGLETVTRGNLSGVVSLTKGQTYNLDILLSNVFGDVGSEYLESCTVSVVGKGTYVKGTLSSRQSYDTKKGTYGGVVESWSDTADAGLQTVTDKCIECSIVGGKLVINAKECYESAALATDSNTTHEDMDRLIYTTTTSKNVYKEDKTDVDGNLPYYQITVSIDGYKTVFNVYISAGVTAVSVDSSGIVF